MIALDCRGHGKSDKPHDPEKYGPEMAADVVRLLDHLKIEKAHLIGYSSGAFIAGKVAATHPERVLSVVYGGQAPVIAGAMKPSDFSEVEIFAKAVDEGKDLGSYIIAVTPAGKPKPTEEQAKAIAKFMYGGKDVKAFAAAGRSFKDLEVTEEQLKKCKAPILFIHGGNESDHVKNRVATVRKLLGRGEVKIVEGGDHMTTLAKPEFGVRAHRVPASPNQSKVRVYYTLSGLRGDGPANKQGGRSMRSAPSLYVLSNQPRGVTKLNLPLPSRNGDWRRRRRCRQRGVAAGATAARSGLHLGRGRLDLRPRDRADELDVHAIAGPHAADQVDDVVRALDHALVDRRDHVARTQAGRLRPGCRA